MVREKPDEFEILSLGPGEGIAFVQERILEHGLSGDIDGQIRF